MTDLIKPLQKLHEELEIAGIPHVFLCDDNPIFGGQIRYASDGKWELRKPGCGDVVCNMGSYGHEYGLLEAMGFDITEEEYGDEVVGYLTVDKAFEFFKRQYEKDQKK